MPPYWGLGFHLCRWGYGSLNGTETVNANMRGYGIPQDVQWNDIEYMDRHLDFTVDQSKWSGLGDFVKKLHNNYHQHYIPIVVSCFFVHFTNEESIEKGVFSSCDKDIYRHLQGFSSNQVQSSLP